MHRTVIRVFHAEVHVPCARALILVDVSMQVERGHHAVLTQWYMAEDEVVFPENPPHGDLVEVVDKVTLDHIVVTKYETLAAV